MIEGRRDICGGRLSTDRRTAASSANAKYFTCLCYSADGMALLAGAKSRFVCIYAVSSGMLLKKFSLSNNRYVTSADLHSGLGEGTSVVTTSASFSSLA